MPTHTLNDTHDPNLRSWIESANRPDGDFPIQNLPFGVFQADPSDEPRIGVAIGDSVFDLAAAAERHLLDNLPPAVDEACAERSLNALMSLGPEAWSALRARLSRLLRDGAGRERPAAAEACIMPMSSMELVSPAVIGDYTDFYASVFHATNVGRMMRPDQPLLPNYKYVPIGYHGRASSIVVSGSGIRRPIGQMRPEGGETPLVGPSRRLDYELEVGFFIGPGNPHGKPILLREAERHLFGVCLLNDWSARDVQAWEYQPLGPFLAKSFATSISPWIVTMEALAPYRVAAFERPAGDPQPLGYLTDAGNRASGGIDISLEVALHTARMRETGSRPHVVSRSRLRDLYWTPGQFIAHHTMNGCNLRPGDLMASGTVSGEAKDSRGCLLELAWRGSEPVALPTGESRAFLADGDEVVFRGWCQKDGYARIGLGECRGLILPAEPAG